MKKLGWAGLVAMGLFSLMFIVSTAWGQSGRRLHYSTLFNPRTVGSVSGQVERVEHALAGNGADYCVHALLKTSTGHITAILGPKGYMQGRGFTIAPQDQVKVTGSLIAIMGKPFILVTEMSGDRTMKLREASGRPVWAVGEDWHVRTASRKPPSAVTR